MSDIIRDVENNCVVALLSAENAQLLYCLDEIRIRFETLNDVPDRRIDRSPAPESSAYDYIEKPPALVRSTASVKFGKVDGEFQWSKTKPVELTSDFERPSLVVFPIKRKDRSCLLSPPKTYPKAEAYWGPYSKDAVLEFINVKCNTYLGSEGELSTEGLHRQAILSNLYSLHNENSLKISDVVYARECAKAVSNMSSINKSIKSTPAQAREDTCTDIQASEKNKENLKKGEDMAENCWSARASGNYVPSENVNSQCEGKMNPNSNEAADQQSKLPEQSRSGHSERAPQLIRSGIPKCERIPEPTKESFFEDCLTRSRPFIIPNGAALWPAISKWNMDFLREEYGEEEVHIKLAPGGIFEGVEPASLWEEHDEFAIPAEVSHKLPYPDLVVVRPATQNIKFSEFLRMIQNSSRVMKKEEDDRLHPHTRVSAYLEYSSIPTYFPALEADVEEPDFARNLLSRRHLNIWLSDGNTLGKLHFDPFDNFLCQLKGKKELTLFEPHHNAQLYEAHIPEALLGFHPASGRFRRKKLMDSTSMVMSPVDVVQPDLEKFPAFADARPLNCTIDEGDILFMPAFWWHEVQSYPNRAEGRNLAVNFWYEPFLHKEFPCPECKLDVNPYYRHLL